MLTPRGLQKMMTARAFVLALWLAATAAKQLGGLGLATVANPGSHADVRAALQLATNRIQAEMLASLPSLEQFDDGDDDDGEYAG